RSKTSDGDRRTERYRRTEENGKYQWTPDVLREVTGGDLAMFPDAPYHVDPDSGVLPLFYLGEGNSIVTENGNRATMPPEPLNVST
ncbi:MAG: hypothetical protein Q4C47_09830, partial [Planctomycetia bacterium]|nr:hypothetical protein [Planctomycetia bacterium]